MESVEKRIKAIVQAGGEGKVYFPSDFFECGSEKAVSKALQRLVDEGFLIRMERGLYCYPEVDTLWGMGKLTASAEEVVRAYAARDGFRTCPSAFEAQNALGLSEQVVCNPVYSTDGPSRVIPYSKGHRPIVLYHISPRIFNYKSDIIRLTVIALLEIGKNDLWQFEMDNLQYIFKSVPYEEIREDLRYIPVWIRRIILSYYRDNDRQN